MGEVIELKDQLADRSRPRGAVRAAFFYDVACPFSYLVAERVERVLGDVEWVPAPAVGLDGGARWARFDATRELAERHALAARLPLVWPDWFPANTRHALRAASYAADNRAGASFAPNPAYFDPAAIVESEGLGAMDGGGEELAAIVAAAIDANADAAQRVREGNAKAAGPIVGAVMRETKGRADGTEVARLIAEQLGT